jgi:hypothetical protein
LREVVRDLAGLAEDERASLLDDRREEIRDVGAQLRQEAWRAIGVASGIGLGIAAGIATAEAGAPALGLLEAAAVTVGGVASFPRKTLTPYSYLFSIDRSFG